MKGARQRLGLASAPPRRDSGAGSTAGQGDLTVLKSPPIYVSYNGVGLATVVPHIDFPVGNPTLNPSKIHHLHGSPVYWHGSNGPKVFVWGENESLRAWRLNPETGALSFIAKGAEVASAALAVAPTGMGGMPGGMLSLSSKERLQKPAAMIVVYCWRGELVRMGWGDEAVDAGDDGI